MAYKTIVINNKCDLRFKDNFLLIDDNLEYLDNIKNIVINTLDVTLSCYLINELNKKNINVIICDEKKNPSVFLSGIYCCGDISKKLIEQINFNDYFKGILWQQIIRNKIKLQNKILNMYMLENNVLEKYIDLVLFNDSTNVEAYAARKYFSKLFGNDFNRRSSNNINSALNYGYTIILTMINRVINSLGYNTALGIKHNNKQNNYNLSCDIIEVFRVLVDVKVIEKLYDPFDSDYKKELLKLLNSTVYYKNKEYKIEVAVEKFFLDIIKFLKGEPVDVGEIDIDNK